MEPRSPEEVRKLPTDWRSLYIQSKAGWLTPQKVEIKNPHPQFDEVYVTDVYYAAHDSPGYDLRLIWRFIFGC